MNTPTAHRPLTRHLVPAVIVAFALVAGIHAQQTATPSGAQPPRAQVPANDIDAEWRQIETEKIEPVPPAAWNEKRPPEAEVQAWLKTEGERLLQFADRAHAFGTKHPEHPQTRAAFTREAEALSSAIQVGVQSAASRLAALDELRLKDPQLAPEERIRIRVRQINAAAEAKFATDEKAARAEYEAGARALIKEFPGRSEPYAMLLELAENAGEKSSALLAEIAASNAEPEIKQRAQVALKRLEAVGKPVDIKFTSIDGREVNVAEMKGKVVLVDFWATWCGPCVAEIPNVKASYEKLHPKGFEIVGLSFDQEKAALEKFVKEKEMPWPQYFDGAGWKNKFGQAFGIQSIPTMWLIDKKGNLRDTEARDDLDEKVTKLLAEQ